MGTSYDARNIRNQPVHLYVLYGILVAGWMMRCSIALFLLNLILKTRILFFDRYWIIWNVTFYFIEIDVEIDTIMYIVWYIQIYFSIRAIAMGNLDILLLDTLSRTKFPIFLGFYISDATIFTHITIPLPELFNTISRYFNKSNYPAYCSWLECPRRAYLGKIIAFIRGPARVIDLLKNNIVQLLCCVRPETMYIRRLQET